MKKLIISTIVGAALMFAVGAKADSQSFVLAGSANTNIFPAPIKLTSLTVIATNTSTLTFIDAPGLTTTNLVGAFSNLTQYATNVGQIYTNFFGVKTTNWLTNALVTITNTVTSQTNTYATVFTYTFPSNTTTLLPNLSLNFVNGVLITNNSANTVTVTPSYTGF